MLHRVRLELTALVAVAISITALVLALTGGGSPAAIAEPPQATSPGDIPEDAHEVDIFDFRYDPDPVRVPAGTTIVWSNSDFAPHTVTADDGSWGSEYMAEGDVFAATFDEPGVYAYICELHPPPHLGTLRAADGDELVFGGGGGRPMHGTVIVE